MGDVPPVTLAGSKLLVDSLTKTASDATDAVWTKSTEALDHLAHKIAEGLLAPFREVPDTAWSQMLGYYQSAELLTSADVNNIKKLKQFGAPFDWLFYVMVSLRLFSSFVGGVTDPAALKIQQGINKQQRPQLPYVSEVIAAAFVAPEKTGEVREILARSGYSEEAIDLLFLAKYRMYEEFQVQALWLRKEISDAKMYERMRELGYTDTRIGELTKLWTIIPPVQDILTMVAHEAFEPDAVRLMGLEDEFPGEQAEWLTKQGLSPFWQMKYWASHWEQPSIQMGFEMLHRGVIDRSTLDMLFRTVELPPFWREKLTQIAYQPYTRVDVRRMYDMGVLGEEQLKKAYTDIGYDDEHADAMVEFTKRYVEDPDRDITKAEILKGYRNRILTRSDAVLLLTDLRYTDAQASYFIELVDYEELEELQAAAIKAIETRYKASLIDRAEAQRLLDSLNLPSATTALWLERWDVSLIEYTKLPSKADLDKFYIAGVISADMYHLEMRKLGYGAVYVGWYKQMADKIKARASAG
ncbi:MAG: hypothetical protein ACW99U_17170 [Candidatus Thorarchaeota archaeon]|jgi:hypothetical protein